MPRPKTTTGTYGQISAKASDTRPASSKWRAWCRYGDADGETRIVQAFGRTRPAAVDRLKKKLIGRKRVGPLGETITPDTTVGELVLMWFERYKTTKGSRPQTVGQYYAQIHPAENGSADKVTILGSPLGRQKIGTVRASQAENYLNSLPAGTIRRWHKTILTGAFDMAVLDDALEVNPFTRTTPSTRSAPRPRAFTADQYAQYRQLETDYFARPHCRTDRRFLDITELTYELAGRLGEALAVRWEDIDFDAGTVAITGTIVDKDDTGKKKVRRQDYPKTDESAGVVKVSTGCLSMLRRRKLATRPGAVLVFENRPRDRKHAPGPINPDDVRGVYRKIVAGTELDWSTPKTLRKTAVTRVYAALGLGAAQEMARHKPGSKVTQTHYIDRDGTVVDYSAAL
ncbi:tyrosine-type recombinase/integrase [Nocardia asteroides]|uniref:tyrosine-type recombinase/integrase n=1 Tax=Nocardia asteroides TaxID=1824 RepID=UPI003413B30B